MDVIELIKEGLLSFLLNKVGNWLLKLTKSFRQKAWGVLIFCYYCTLLWLDKIGIIKLNPATKQAIQFTLLITVGLIVFFEWVKKINRKPMYSEVG